MVSNHNNNSQKRKPPQKNANDNKPFKKQNTGNKGNGQGTTLASNAPKNEGFKGKCNYCQKFGHKMADCRKLKAKQEKKGNLLVKVCLESNVVDVPSNTWWLDTGATIHVTNSLQEMIKRRKPTSVEQHVYMGDGTRTKVEFWGDNQTTANHRKFFGVTRSCIHTLN